ncbi:MAG: aminotransferase class IV, partial [Armatimonadota bacterium]|nr:aminotransferase class IV [Armatimonadota bacterium]
REGGMQIESAALASLPKGAMPVALARTPISRGDKFLCHKTTHRAVYEAHRRDHPSAFDVLLWNEEGELTEFTIGNLVIEQDGRLWTPPRECGLLAGTLRAEFLASGRVQERIVSRDDLGNVSQIWLINSVRGFVPVAILGD